MLLKRQVYTFSILAVLAALSVIYYLYFTIKNTQNNVGTPAHKIVYLFSPPRSLSVAFMRMMEARGDFTVFQEPSLKAYEKKYYPQHLAWFLDVVPETFSEVKARVLKEAQTRNVFVKEMAVSVKDFLIEDNDLIRNPNVKCIFLARNPHHAILSCYKKYNNLGKLPASECGYESTYLLLKAIQERGVIKPLVVHSEDLYENPERTAQVVCNYLGIEFLPKMLTWKDLGEDFSGHEQWHETKHKEITQHWHGDAIRSTGFGKPTQYEVDAQGKPTFSEVKDPAQRAAIIAAYNENKHYYDLIRKES